MKYSEILEKVLPFQSPLTLKSYIALVDKDKIKEKAEIDLDYWLLCLAIMKKQEIKNNNYELNYVTFGYKLKVEIVEEEIDNATN